MRRIALAVVALTMALAACGDDDAAAGTEPPPEGVVLRVVAGGEVAADWTLADLEAAVAFTTVTLEGEDQSGPLLLDVLAASGVADWSTAEALGLGEGRTFEVSIELSADDVDEGWILDVTNRGTLKLASDDLPKQQWVRDVAELRLR
jgi:hypothetical protein